jgi:transposase-like protein
MMNEVSMSPTKSSKPSRKRRSFTPEFKAEAVRLVRTSGKSISALARELDLTETALRAWVKRAGIDERRDPNGPLTTDERAELSRLRRELRAAEQERDFLKKAAAYFAKGQS